MKLPLKRIGDTLIPSSDKSAEVFSKLKEGEEILVEYKKHRSVKFHRLYWEFVKTVCLNQEHYKTQDNLHEAIKYRAGYYETVFTMEGKELIVTKSISFESMDDIKFREYFEHAKGVATELLDDESVKEILKFL